MSFETPDPQPMEQYPSQPQQENKEVKPSSEGGYERMLELCRQYNEAIRKFEAAQREVSVVGESIIQAYTEGGPNVKEKIDEANKRAEEATAAYNAASAALEEAQERLRGNH